MSANSSKYGDVHSTTASRCSMTAAKCWQDLQFSSVDELVFLRNQLQSCLSQEPTESMRDALSLVSQAFVGSVLPHH